MSNVLRFLYDYALSRARNSREDRHFDLRGGARVAVRAREGVVSVTFSRPEKPVGDVELITFVQHCNVPAGARRIPAEGQAERHRPGDDRIWYCVSYQWSEQ